ncbi:MAG: fibronectin type III domain-containing protein [Patescibacteria group bacterium]
MNEQPDIQLPESSNSLKSKITKRLRIDRLHISSRAKAVVAVVLFAVVGSVLLFITNALPTNVINSANFSAEGELKRYIIEDFEKIKGGKEGFHREEFFLKTNTGDQVKLNLPEEAQQKLKGGSRVRISGNKTGDTVTVEQNYAASIQVLAEPPAGTDLTTTDPSTTTASTNRKVAVILINFTDDTSQPVTVDAARREVFTDPNYSANAFYKRSSYNLLGLTGHTNVDGDIFGYYTIGATKSGNCDYTLWGRLADQAAQSAGADLSVYNHIIYAFPSANCGFGGIADLPGSHVWLNGSISGTPLSHELGHNLGLYHANGFACKDTYGFTVSISDRCSSLEYYDMFDTMGSGFNLDDFNGYYKRRLNWLVPSNTQTVTTSGDYTINSLESTGSGVNEIRIPRYVTAAGITQYLHLEYRQRNGEGVLVRQVDETFGRSYLFDTTDETAFFWQFKDAPLAIGRTLTDATYNITITPISSTPSSVKIRITITGTTITKGKPSKRTTTTPAPPENAQYVSTTAPLAVKPGGQVFSASITMKNTGTTTWTAADYQLGAIVIPSNKWGQTRLSLSRDVAPGATATFTGTFTSPEAMEFDRAQSFSWRMLKNSTNTWFGGALTKAITVSNDLTAPAQPMDLKTTAVTSSSVSLSWTASSTPGVAGYRVYRVNSGGALYLAGYTTYTTVFTDAIGLSPSTPYTYYIVAINYNGLESLQSTSVNVTTLK